MNSELNQLYQEVILDHNRQPKNFHDMKDADRHAEGFNPLCGDRCTVYLKLDDGKVSDVSFQGSGCAISKASTSIMTTVVKGKKLEEVDRLFNVFHEMVTGKTERASGFAGVSGLMGGSGGARSDPPLEAKLQVFSGVSEFPARVKCASLAWHTLKAALAGQAEPVSTETGEDSGSGA